MKKGGYEDKGNRFKKYYRNIGGYLVISVWFLLLHSIGIRNETD